MYLVMQTRATMATPNHTTRLLLQLLPEPQLRQILPLAHHHAATFDVRAGQDLLVRNSKLRRLHYPELVCCSTCHHEQAEIDLVEADICVRIVEACHVRHGE